MYKISFANIAIISQLAVVNVRLLLIQRNSFTIFVRITIATTSMKKLFIAVTALLFGILAVRAQELTIPQIREEWPKASLKVDQVKGKIGISELAYAVAKAFPGNSLTDELKAQLDSPERDNEDVDEFILDRQNGYCSLDFVSDGTVNMEMCCWSR